jgi:restriction endonuclease S subunit
MKKGWQTKTIGEVCEFQRGLTYAKNDEVDVSDNVVLRATNIDLTTNLLIFDELKYISDKVIVPERKKVKKGSLMICTASGSKSHLGKVALIDDDYGYAFGGFMGMLTPLNGLMPKYLFHLMTSDDYKNFIGALSDGANINNLTFDNLKRFPVPVPPMTEQQRIVDLLDEAFEGIATAKANTEKNLQNARALFDSHLQSVFAQNGETRQVLAKSPKQTIQQGQVVAGDAEMALLNAGYVTRTGGRAATMRHIPGDLSLAVGMPSTGTRRGWRWSALTDLARLESGHTPSRRRADYWGGLIPWIGIQDARENHGQRISDTFQKTNELGIANSSARVLPENTVCLSRTASVGYIVVMARPMATSQDFVNWVCSDKLQPDFLKYLILAEGREGLLRYASGSVHQTIYFPEAKAFHICHPEQREQLRIVRQCDALRDETQRLARIYEQKLAELEALKKSLIHQAFSGQL